MKNWLYNGNEITSIEELPQDAFGFILLSLLIILLIFFYPNLLGDPENFINANPLVTPTHIMPE